MITPINFFLRKKTSTTANTAKKRLQIIVSKRKNKNKFDLNRLPQFKNDLIQIIQKYIQEPQIISIQFQKKDNNTSILKLDIFFSNKKI